MAVPVVDLSPARLRWMVDARTLARAGALHLEAYARRGDAMPPGKAIPRRFKVKAAEEVASVVCRDGGLTRDEYAAALAGEGDADTLARAWRGLGVEP